MYLSTKITAPDYALVAFSTLCYEVDLLCPATAIPEKIIVDLDGIKIGDSIHISAIPLPDGVEPTITDRDFTVATIASPGGGVKNEEDDGEVLRVTRTLARTLRLKTKWLTI